MIDVANFHFLRPEWFLSIIPLLIILFASRRIKRQQSGWQGVLAPHLYQHLVGSKSQPTQRLSLLLMAIAGLMAITALAGPTWQQLPQPVYQLNSGKVVLLDMSMSMRSTDIKPDRLTRAKFKAIDLINQIAEGDVGLVAYAGDAFTISPLSSDAQNLTTLLPSLSPEIMPVAGSEPYLGLKRAAGLLQNAGFLDGEIFWITDGVEMAQLAELNKFIAALPYRVSILGVGTEEGAPIQLLDGDFLKDNRGAIVIPKMDKGILAGLATKSNGRYSNISADDSDIKRLTEQSLTATETDSQQQSKDEFGDKWYEAGPYLLLILLPIAALSFRRGYLTVMVLTLFGGMLLPRPALAFDIQELFKNNDQKGLSSFQQDEFEDAAAQFDNPIWKGGALYRSGDFSGALDAFRQSDSVEALYNQGNALAQLGELDQALQAYSKVLDQQPNHSDAAQNKALIEELKQQQEQQQQQSEQNQQTDENQSSDQDQSDQQDQDQQQQSDQQQDDSQQQQSDPQQNDSQQNSQQQDEQESASEDQPKPSEQTPQDEQSQNEQQEEEEQEQQAQAQQAQESEEPLTDEQREQMQRMQNLLNRVPDDPAFLLKRKMMLENRQRRANRSPSQSKRNW
ncbi:VWA domain-containing protein [Aliiglaciecola sp. LCG003]|uniref:vWA domain-containing protein n=1 Tax=Aliiglaciecola sp. LCG003 TaxID=3053655 RepID=UPI0025724714|nr:VWA domain-containing protein [Aliiglaciecola sp. LCG003]WJG10626.1 VWA domain-containing protein [Aliiglaciecola sp. LCG003]